MASLLPDQRFLSIRSQLIELAASLDRAERHAPDQAGLAADPRWGLVRQAVGRLDGGGGRAEALQELFSDAYEPTWRADGGPRLAGSRGCCGE